MGLERTLPSPLGRIFAISHKKTRIAIANWDIVKIWSIHPTAFLDKKVGCLVPEDGLDNIPKFWKPLKSEEASGPDDTAYTARCGHGYYRSYVQIKAKKQRRIVAIEPVELPKMGVVYKLDLVDENRLLAWTDRGIVSWYWGAGRNGERIEQVLHKVAVGT